MQVSNTYQAIASAYYNLLDFRTALDNQQKAYKILQGVLPADNQHVKTAHSYLEQYLKLSLQQERTKVEHGQRAIGQNKPAGASQ